MKHIRIRATTLQGAIENSAISLSEDIRSRKIEEFQMQGREL